MHIHANCLCSASFLRCGAWKLRLFLHALVLAATAFTFTPPAVADDLKKTASWNWPDPSNFESQISSYLDQRQANDETRRNVEALWSDANQLPHGPDFLQRLLDIASLIDDRIKVVNEQLQNPLRPPMHPRDLEWLTSDVPGWMQDTIRLACGRAFAQQRMFDEGLESLEGLELMQVCDPASLLFYRASCEHHLLKQKECLASLTILLEREDELPARYAQLAKLMQSDIAPMQADSLDEISRLMRDVERRLDLGRAGKTVRDEEQEIVDKLEKMIEDIEQQLQQQQDSQSGEGSSQSQGGSQPMEDSQIAGGGGPGDVDNKKQGERADWGNLPPAQRQESLQRLTEELPSHYREVIEGYFRQLAKEPQ